MKAQRIAFFGSSLVSAYWNGAATYYRGILQALARLGYSITFYESDAFERQKHRDIENPSWANVVVYPHGQLEAVYQCLEDASEADIIVKASGNGVLDEFLEAEVCSLKTATNTIIFWDVDAPATLAAMRSDESNPLRALVSSFDLVLTYGGGIPVVNDYLSFGARQCVPIYNALDPGTHHPVQAQDKFRCDLSFLGNRLPDREARVAEFFLKPATLLPARRFILGGSGWNEHIVLPANVNYVGHVYTHEHNAFNCSARAVLNVSRDSMANNGFSPATRFFEVAGAGACLITDAWDGIECFLEPGSEVLVAQNAEEVASHLESLTEEKAKSIGTAARRSILSKHTYHHRAEVVHAILQGLM